MPVYRFIAAVCDTTSLDQLRQHINDIIDNQWLVTIDRYPFTRSPETGYSAPYFSEDWLRRLSTFLKQVF